MKEDLPTPAPWKLHPWCLGICKMQMVYITDSLRSLRNSNGKLHKKDSGGSGTVIRCGRMGQKDIYYVVFLRLG